MTKQTYRQISTGRRARTVALIAFVVGPALAHKTPVTPQQLKAYDDAFMEEVKKGDCCSTATMPSRKKMGVTFVYHWHGLRDVPSDDCRHPSAFISKISGTDGQVRNAARHDQLVH